MRIERTGYQLLTTLLFSVVLLFESLSAQELSPAHLEQIGKMISEIENTLTGGVANNNGRALSACSSAASSPKAAGAFFLECTKIVNFDEAGKRDSDWREWEDDNEDWITEDEHLAARQLQLRFLVLKLQYAQAATRDEETAKNQLVPALLKYYDTLAAGVQHLAGQQSVLSESVSNSIYAQRLKLDITLEVPEPWVDRPLPVSGAYDGAILPLLRELENHSALMSAWDRRIEHEKSLLSLKGRSTRSTGNNARSNSGKGNGKGGKGGGNDRESEREQEREAAREAFEQLEKFEAVRVPTLMWLKAVDDFEYGSSPSTALFTMARLLRDNLEHPSAKDWLQQLKGMASPGNEEERELES